MVPLGNGYESIVDADRDHNKSAEAEHAFNDVDFSDRHLAYCQYCKTSLASSLASIVAVLAAAAARIAQSIGKELAYLVEALRACWWRYFRVMFVCYCRVSKLPERQRNQVDLLHLSVQEWCCCQAGELSERNYVGVKACPRQG
jgi:hypothetical protein